MATIDTRLPQLISVPRLCSPRPRGRNVRCCPSVQGEAENRAMLSASSIRISTAKIDIRIQPDRMTGIQSMDENWSPHKVVEEDPWTVSNST
jgi:hypothetical protein